MDISQQEVFVQKQPKIKTLFLTKSIPLFLGLGCFYLAWRLCVRFDWFVPFRYLDNDFLFAFAFIKRLTEGIWYFNTSYAGFPFGANFLYYPLSEAGNFAVLKILTVFLHNFALVVNKYIILELSVIAITSYWVAQKLQLTKISSLVVAILFAFLPYHFYALSFIWSIYFFVGILLCHYIHGLLLKFFQNSHFFSKKLAQQEFFNDKHFIENN